MKKFVVASLLALPSVLAFDFGTFGLASVFERMYWFFAHPYVNGGITFLAFFAILLAIYKVGLGRVPVFKDQKKQLNTVAVSLALISSIGIFFVNQRSFYEMVRLVQVWLGGFGAILFSLVMGMLLYYMFDSPKENGKRHWSLVLIGFGVTLMLGGMLLQEPWMSSWGLLFFVIGIIALLVHLFRRSGSGKDDESGKKSGGGGDDGEEKGPGGKGPGGTGPGGTGPGGQGPGEKPNKTPSGLDNDHPGRIRVLVTNVDENPVDSATVRVFALDMPLWRRALGRHTKEMMMFKGRTNVDGLWPGRTTFALIGSGPVKIKVSKNMKDRTEEHLIVPSSGPQDVQVIHITLDGRGEKDQRYEPFIESVERHGDQLHLRGRVT